MMTLTPGLIPKQCKVKLRLLGFSPHGQKAVLVKKNPFTDTLSPWPAGCCRDKQQNKTKLIIQKAYRTQCLGAFLLKRVLASSQNVVKTDR